MHNGHGSIAAAMPPSGCESYLSIPASCQFCNMPNSLRHVAPIVGFLILVSLAPLPVLEAQTQIYRPAPVIIQGPALLPPNRPTTVTPSYVPAPVYQQPIYQQPQSYPQALPPQTVPLQTLPPPTIVPTQPRAGTIIPQPSNAGGVPVETATRLDKYKRYLKILMKQNSDLKSEVEDLKKSVARKGGGSNSALPNEELETLREKSRSWLIEIRDLRTKISTQETERNALLESVEAQKANAVQAQAENNQLRQQMANATPRSNEMADRLQQQLSAAEREILSLKADQARAAAMASTPDDSAMKDLERELAMQRSENQQLSDDLREARSMATTPDTSIADAAIKKANLLAAENQRLDQQYAAATEQQSVLQRRLDSLALSNDAALRRQRELELELLAQEGEMETTTIPPSNDFEVAAITPNADTAPDAVVRELESYPVSSAPKRLPRKRDVVEVERVEVKPAIVEPAVATGVVVADPPVTRSIPLPADDNGPKTSAMTVSPNGFLTWLRSFSTMQYVWGMILFGLAIGLSVAYTEHIKAKPSLTTDRTQYDRDRDER